MKGPVWAALLVLACLAAAQDDPAMVERELYRAVRAECDEQTVLRMCKEARRRHPSRWYPCMIMGDTLFRLHRLQSAVRAYDEALALMPPAQRDGAEGKQVGANRAAAGELLDQIRRGIVLEGRATWVGAAILILMISLVLWSGLARRS